MRFHCNTVPCMHSAAQPMAHSSYMGEGELRCLFCHRGAICYCFDCWVPLCFEHMFKCDRRPPCGYRYCWNCHEDHECPLPGSLQLDLGPEVTGTDTVQHLSAEAYVGRFDQGSFDGRTYSFAVHYIWELDEGN